DTCLWICLADRADRLHAGHRAELKVHQRDVGATETEELHGLLARRCRAHDLHVALPFDDEGDAFAHDAVVVDAQYADAIGGHQGAPADDEVGTTVSTRVPVPVAL